jgi:hypothetical protein
LEIWSEAGRQLNLWWRDDDARSPSRDLERLVDLAEKHRVALTLAVIPDRNLERLAASLEDCRLVTTIQHGVDHVNRSRRTWLPLEFDVDHPVGDILMRLTAGRERLSAMARHRDLLAPPWNRIGANVISAAAKAGFAGISAFGGPSRRQAGLAHIDAHLDPLRWNDGAKFRGAASIYRRIRRLMRERRRTNQWHEPIGLLTHHLQHDSESWNFLEGFLAETAARPVVRWRSIGELIDCPTGELTQGASSYVTGLGLLRRSAV